MKHLSVCLHFLPPSLFVWPVLFFLSKDELLKGAEEVEGILKNQIVQGQLNEEGRYSVKLSSEMIGSSEKEELVPIDSSFLGQDVQVMVSHPGEAGEKK